MGFAPIATSDDGAVPPAENGTVDAWSADATRLAADIRRAVRDLQWATLKLRGPMKLGDLERAVVTDAMLVDGRTARILAHPEGDDAVRVRVRAGRFGDEREERRFLDALRKMMEGPAVKERDAGFKLP